MIYFDNAATTPPLPELKEKALEFFDVFGNPSSLHSEGLRAEKLIKNARESLERAVGGGNVFFTSSGTEANNIALLSGAEKNRRAGNRIIITNSEHPSVDRCANTLEKRGFEVVRLSTTGGKLDMNELEKVLDKPVCLVSVMRVNNETGAIYDVARVSSIVKKHYPRALVHSDCVQAFLKEKITLESLGADMISVSSHKVHSLKGSGALILKKGLTLPPHTHGGGQEKGVRSGTENTVGIALFGEAVRILSHDTEGRERVKRVYEKLVSLLSGVHRVTLNIPETPAHSILNFSVDGVRSETLLHALSARGVFVSSGSACSSKSGPSPVLHAFGLDKARGDSALRVSLSPLNTEAEAEEFVLILQEEIKRLAR